MRLGLLGPAEGNVDGLGRAAELLVDRLKVERAVYLGNDGALDEAVAAWAARARRERPERRRRLVARGRASPSRARRRRSTPSSRKERARQRLRVLEGLPTRGDARTIEMIGDRVAVLLYDKGALDEEDIFAASLLVYGKSPEPLVKKVGDALVRDARARSARRAAASACSTTAARRSSRRSTPLDGTCTSPRPIAVARATKMKIQGGGVTANRVAVFGGSFNPPHVAHVLAVAFVLATEEIDRVLVVPDLPAPVREGARAVRRPRRDVRARDGVAAAAWRSRAWKRSSGARAARCGRSSTCRRSHPDWSMRLLMGADLLLEAPRWFRFDAIVRDRAPARPRPSAAWRPPGAPPPVLPAISSTDVRAKIAAGEWDELAQLVPREVLALIRARKLYAREERLHLRRGKVGRALARALASREARPARDAARRRARGCPKSRSTRTSSSSPCATATSARSRRSSPSAGSSRSGRRACTSRARRRREAIAPLRAVSAGVAQMHPMISFASPRVFPTLARGHVHVKGDPVAEKRARALAKRLGMTPRTFEIARHDRLPRRRGPRRERRRGPRGGGLRAPRDVGRPRGCRAEDARPAAP